MDTTWWIAVRSAGIWAGPPPTTACARRCVRRAWAQILDIVPNHMAITGSENPWWWDVLENGPASQYSAYFDVDWEPPEARLRNTVLLPILGDDYGRVLEAGQITLVRDGGDFTIRCNDSPFPVAPRSLDNLLAQAAERCGSNELAFIADSLTALPFSTATDSQSVRRRQRDVGVLKGAIDRLIGSSPDVAAAIDHTVAEFNADHDQLHAVLERRIIVWPSGARPDAISATAASSISAL